MRPRVQTHPRKTHVFASYACNNETVKNYRNEDDPFKNKHDNSVEKMERFPASDVKFFKQKQEISLTTEQS